MGNSSRRTRPVRIVETGEVFESAAACARHLNMPQSTMYYCLSKRRYSPDGKGYSFNGYTFEYADVRKEIIDGRIVEHRPRVF